VHPIADWAGIICCVRSVDVRRMPKEGLGGWSIGKLDAVIAPN